MASGHGNGRGRRGSSANPPLRSLAHTLREGGISSEALTRDAIFRRQAAAPALDAYTHFAPEVAIAMARSADEAFARGASLGQLHGIPVSIKDLFAVDGMPFFAGSPRALPAALSAEGPVVARMREQRAVFMGKTHTSELGFGVCGHNVHWGTPRNPWDVEHLRPAGGSSSGAAISLLEGSAHLALGSDTGGSAREPANMTGIVGLKITHGRWSGAGLIPPGPNLHGPGLLARTVADAAFGFSALDSLRNPQELDDMCAVAEPSRLRIGVLEQSFWDECEPGIAEAVQAALDEMAKAGAKLAPCALPEAGELQRVAPEWDFGISGVELFEFLISELPDWWQTLHPGARRQIEACRSLSAVEYLRRCRLLAMARRSAAPRVAAFDVVVCPTSPLSPPLTCELFEPERYRQINRLAVRNMCVANLLDMCALTMPVALGPTCLPIGIQLMAGRGRDDILLAAAAVFERVLGTGYDRLGVAPLVARLQG
jgi:aspartyl-tRNA(Asn)/glutamyl-tRNA(Gln) amidotransferase subunit A